MVVGIPGPSFQNIDCRIVVAGTNLLNSRNICVNHFVFVAVRGAFMAVNSMQLTIAEIRPIENGFSRWLLMGKTGRAKPKKYKAFSVTIWAGLDSGQIPPKPSPSWLYRANEAKEVSDNNDWERKP